MSSWYDDCSSITGWELDYMDNTSPISDGVSILPEAVVLDPVNIDYADLAILKNVDISGDFEIDFDVTIPTFNGVGAASQYFDIYVNLLGNDGGRRDFDFYITGGNGDPFTLEIYGWTDPFEITLPYSTVWKIKRVGDQLTMQLGETVIYLATNATGFSITDIDIEWYAGYVEVGYTWNGPQINDIAATWSGVSSNANLASALFEGLTLTPSIDPDVLNYTAKGFQLPIGRFTPTTASLLSTLKTNGVATVSGVETIVDLEPGDNVVTVEVTAEDGVTVKTYTFTITRLILDTNLSGLVPYTSAGLAFAQDELGIYLTKADDYVDFTGADAKITSPNTKITGNFEIIANVLITDYLGNENGYVNLSPAFKMNSRALDVYSGVMVQGDRTYCYADEQHNWEDTPVCAAEIRRVVDTVADKMTLYVNDTLIVQEDLEEAYASVIRSAFWWQFVSVPVDAYASIPIPKWYLTSLYALGQRTPLPLKTRKAYALVQEHVGEGYNGSMVFAGKNWDFAGWLEEFPITTHALAGEFATYSYGGETVTYGTQTYSFLASGITDPTAIGGYGSYTADISRTVLSLADRENFVDFYYTTAAAVTVTTDSIADETLDGFTTNITVANNGLASPILHAGFVWGTDTDPTLETAAYVDLGASEYGSLAPVYSGGDIQPDTTYYVRGFATTAYGAYYGDELDFNVAAVLPTVTTDAVDGLSKTGFTAQLSVTALGDKSVTFGFVWGTVAVPRIGDGSTNLELGTMTSPRTIRYNHATTLVVDTQYYLAAYATNSAGTAYGADVPFKLTSAFSWEFIATPDHDRLNNLTTGDDHTQYHTDARGDARYSQAANLAAVTDGAAGADAVGATPLTETGAANTVQGVLEAMMALLTNAGFLFE